MTPFSSSTVPRISDIFVSIRPSSLDAVFFGHIARIMCYSAHLRNYLFNYPNLVDYYDGIMKRYFAPSLGVPTSETALIVETIGKIDCSRAYGMHIACVAPADPSKILPYANEGTCGS